MYDMLHITSYIHTGTYRHILCVTGEWPSTTASEPFWRESLNESCVQKNAVCELSYMRCLYIPVFKMVDHIMPSIVKENFSGNMAEYMV